MSSARADTPPANSWLLLSAAQQAAIARAFAPTLVFHPLEEYFPTNSIPLSGSGTLLSAPPDPWTTRVARYRELSPAEKLRDAAVAYRVFSRVRQGHDEVVVEYWCYYLYNVFTARGTWLPYRVSADHPHDLERVYLVLTPTRPLDSTDEPADEAWARRVLRIRSVIANAHDGAIPPNQFEAGDALVLPSRLDLLVERGSHAMAPDVNGDGRFTPGIDSRSRVKMQWGIRDKGSTWGWYRASFMDRREDSAPRLCGPAADDGDAVPCHRYALYPADDLQSWFGAFELSRQDRREILGQTPLLLRTFGDAHVEQLMVPTDPPDGRVLAAMLRRRTTPEAGFVAGFVTGSPPALMLGRRYFWRLDAGHAPDVIVEAVALLPGRGPWSYEATVWSSYGVDAITNLLLGAGWFSEGKAADIVAGVDLRLGRWRIRPTWRVRERAFSSRISMTF